MGEYKEGEPTVAILKHNNACGLATRRTLSEAYTDALAGDPISAFGGVVISNRTMDLDTAEALHTLFCEVVIAPDFAPEALALLSKKKNRILLEQRRWPHSAERLVRSALRRLPRPAARRPNGGRVRKHLPAPPKCRAIGMTSSEDLAFALKLCQAHPLQHHRPCRRLANCWPAGPGKPRAWTR